MVPKRTVMKASMAFVVTLMTSLCVSNCAPRELTPNEMVGLWVIKEADREYLPEPLRGAESKVVINANSAFVASNLVGSAVYGVEGDSIVVSGSGTWRLDSSYGRQVLQLTFLSMDPRGRLGPPFTTSMDVTLDGELPLIFFYIGDADAGLRIYLTKQLPEDQT